MNIRILTNEEVTWIFNHYMLDDFGEDEVKPLASMFEMKRQGMYEMYGFFEEEELKAYAFLCGYYDQKVVLLDYLAVMKNARGRGYGSALLAALRNQLSFLDGLLIETEDIQAAENEEETRLRQRRVAFYERSGAQLTDTYSRLWGVQYRVMYLPIARALTFEEEYQHLDRIYNTMFDEKKRKFKVRLWRKSE